MDIPAEVAGDLLGVSFPTTIEALRDRAAPFLTEAFRAAGALSADNAVAAVREANEFWGGGMGRKLTLSVAYERPEAGLQTELFIKFPRDPGDPLRPLFTPLMEPEARFALLSRREGFPIAVPRCFFADYNAATTSGIIITERIAFGADGIEPAYEKCKDYLLADPLPYYRALATAMARLAGSHKAGRLGSNVSAMFPFDPEIVDPGSRIAFGPRQLAEKLAVLRDFFEAVPHLIPAELRSRRFLDDFAHEAAIVLEHEDRIRAHLNHQTDRVALCHLNANIDNAWFRTGPDGALEVGLLDWGGVGQMSLGAGFYGLTCSCETDFLNKHRRTLMALIVEEYRRSGGPEIAVDDYAQTVKLACALLGVAWMLDAPSLVASCIPDYRDLKSRFDPRLQENFLARVQLQPLIALLNEWREDGYGIALRAIARH